MVDGMKYIVWDGMYMMIVIFDGMSHSEMAQTLLDDVLETVIDQQPDYLLSSNIGCILHIAAGLQEQGVKTQIMHPIVLLDRQLHYAAMTSKS